MIDTVALANPISKATASGKQKSHKHSGYVYAHMWRNPFTGKGQSIRPEIVTYRIQMGKKLLDAKNYQEYKDLVRNIEAHLPGTPLTITMETEWKAVALAFHDHPLFRIDVVCYLPWKILDIVSEKRGIKGDELIDVVLPFYHYIEHWLDAQKPEQERTLSSVCQYAMLPRVEEANKIFERLPEMAIIAARIEHETHRTVRKPELLQKPLPAFVTGYRTPVTKETPALTVTYNDMTPVAPAPKPSKEPSVHEQAQALSVMYQALMEKVREDTGLLITQTVTAVRDEAMRQLLDRNPEREARLALLEQEIERAKVYTEALEQENTTLKHLLDTEKRTSTELQHQIDSVQAFADMMTELARKFNTDTLPKAQQELVPA